MPPGHRSGSTLIALALGVSIFGIAQPASAWVELHIAADDARLSIDPSGSAQIEHRITLKISGGPLPSFDIKGVDPDAAPDPDGYVIPLKDAATNSLASAAPVSTELLPPDNRPREDGSVGLPTLRIRFEDKGLKRGVYVVSVRYRTNMAQRGLIQQDGSMARIRWRGPVWEDGFDSARAIFALPLGATPPRVDQVPQEDADAPTVLSTLRRGTDKDELELVRPYSPKGEPIDWTVRLDARALQVTSQAPEAEPPRDVGRLSLTERMIAAAVAVVLLFLYGLLAYAKSGEVERSARAAGSCPRPLIPLPRLLRAALAGLSLVVGVSLQLGFDRGTSGALFVALATALVCHRTAPWSRTMTLRKPGRWLPVSETEAFRSPPRPQGPWLDVSTRAGKLMLAVSLGALSAAVLALARHSAYYAQLVALDVVALLGIFCTGRITELPPDPAVHPAPLLRKIATQLRKTFQQQVRLVGRIRVPEGSAIPDELRLGVSPRKALRGFSGIEVGVVYVPGAGGAIGLPEVLLRVTSGSECERAVEKLASHGRTTRGRRHDERVIAFSPRLPTARMTAGIVAALLRAVQAPAVTEVAKPAKGLRRVAEVLRRRAA